MDVIRDPKEKALKLSTKSVLIGRLPRREGDKFKTAVVRLYNVNNPHKTTEFPVKTYEFSDTEKVRIRRLNVSYYLEGNDIVINDLEELYILREDNKLIIKGYQIEVEKRD
ncbi:hypothetical protein KY359_05125 [Candidatus Woesearchaeota archaeon]|nr:hypothetical protein [Candidatus Woesearchaeota archaeon]